MNSTIRPVPVVTHLLFDFFGTLVTYSPSRTAQGYHHTHMLLNQMNINLSYSEFLRKWSNEALWYDQLTAQDHREFSMDDVCESFLAKNLKRRPTESEVAALKDTYLAEWNKGVAYPKEMPRLVRLLAGNYQLAVVSNTHDHDLVPNHLKAMKIMHYFDAVITSVDVGWRKPHPLIYQRALQQLRISPADAIFIGDSYIPDYVGSLAAGICALLIDPANAYGVPASSRLRSIRELPERLGLIEAQASVDGVANSSCDRNDANLSGDPRS